MANLHRTQYANNPRHAPRNPTTFLTYLGSVADGYPEPTWLVHGEETTDVSTCGTGHPTRGMQYLGAAQDPDTGRGWMVRCDRQSSKVTPRKLISKFFDYWFRFGRAMNLRHSAPWDDSESNSVVFSGSGFSGNGTIIRTKSDGSVFVTNEEILKLINLESDESTESDFSSPISSLCIGETSNRVYCTTLTFVSGGGGGDCYVTGYDAAIAESGAFTQGQSDCLGELGYRAADLAIAWAEANAPTEGGEDCIADWISGATVGYTEQYNLGYESEGCVIP